MKTFTQLLEWLRGAAEQHGDPSLVTGHAFFRCCEPDNLPPPPDDSLQAVFDDGELILYVTECGEPISLPVRVGPPEIGAAGVDRFGLEQISANVWALSPSLNMPGEIHVFVTLYDVPLSPPWERKIILPHGVHA